MQTLALQQLHRQPPPAHHRKRLARLHARQHANQSLLDPLPLDHLPDQPILAQAAAVQIETRTTRSLRRLLGNSLELLREPLGE
jgi:hypothetical protein